MASMQIFQLKEPNVWGEICNSERVRTLVIATGCTYRRKDSLLAPNPAVGKFTDCHTISLMTASLYAES